MMPCVSARSLNTSSAVAAASRLPGAARACHDIFPTNAMSQKCALERAASRRGACPVRARVLDCAARALPRLMPMRRRQT